jgi:hypothetical protein
MGKVTRKKEVTMTSWMISLFKFVIVRIDCDLVFYYSTSIWMSIP